MRPEICEHNVNGTYKSTFLNIFSLNWNYPEYSRLKQININVYSFSKCRLTYESNYFNTVSSFTCSSIYKYLLSIVHNKNIFLNLSEQSEILWRPNVMFLNCLKWQSFLSFPYKVELYWYFRGQLASNSHFPPLNGKLQ